MSIPRKPKVALKLKWVKFHSPIEGEVGKYKVLGVRNSSEFKRDDWITEADVDRLHASGGTTSS